VATSEEERHGRRRIVQVEAAVDVCDGRWWIFKVETSVAASDSGLLARQLRIEDKASPFVKISFLKHRDMNAIASPIQQQASTSQSSCN